MNVDEVKDGLQMMEIVARTLPTIRALAMRAEVDKAPDALQVIALIVEVLEEGFEGKTTPDVVEAELRVLQPHVAIVLGESTHDKFDLGDE